MLVDDLLAAVGHTPRTKLPDLALNVWKAHGVGMVSDDDAQALAELIQERKNAPMLPPEPRRPAGSRPRSPASIERRRRWAATGWLPAQIAAHFTQGEVAALAVVAQEVHRSGTCVLPIGAIAGLAGVGKTTVRNALHEAKALGLLEVQEHRVSACRNKPNTIRIVAASWSAWLRLRGKGGGRGGSKLPARTNNTDISNHLEGSAGARVNGDRGESGISARASSLWALNGPRKAAGGHLSFEVVGDVETDQCPS